MTELDPWFEGFATHVGDRMALMDAIRERDVVKVASLVGATEVLDDLLCLADSTWPHRIPGHTLHNWEVQAFSRVEDAIVLRFIEAMERDFDSLAGGVCKVWNVPCSRKAHTMIAVALMAYNMRVITQVWRPSWERTYENMLVAMRQQLIALREEADE